MTSVWSIALMWCFDVEAHKGNKLEERPPTVWKVLKISVPGRKYEGQIIPLQNDLS